ncbi:MAG: cupin domain-containing protein [Verrucomicrobia bacterium]|nr:MAG: cupin domain-containing protein [Verrucomicrobiota bacterium]
MDPIADRRFVAAAEAVTELSPFTLNAWMSRPDIVPCRELLMVRATMEPGFCHPFHRHPTREEIIYVLSGQAEQWCGDRHRVLKPGEMVLIPAGEAHGTYNPFREPVVFLAILAPAGAAGPDMVDVSGEAPWVGKREGLGLPACVTRADPAVSRAPG